MSPVTNTGQGRLHGTTLAASVTLVLSSSLISSYHASFAMGYHMLETRYQTPSAHMGWIQNFGRGSLWDLVDGSSPGDHQLTILCNYYTTVMHCNDALWKKQNLARRWFYAVIGRVRRGSSYHNDSPPLLPWNCLIQVTAENVYFTFAFDRAWLVATGIAEAKRILATAVCVSVCLSLAAFPHYCTDPDVTWGNGRGCFELSTIGRICNRCTGFVAMTTYMYANL